jgi:hypothetical protein
MHMPVGPQIRRRWRREIALIAVLAAIGAALAAVAAGGVLLGALALGFFCVAGVGGALLVFYEIGRGEDRARAIEERRQGASRSTRHTPSERR